MIKKTKKQSQDSGEKMYVFKAKRDKLFENSSSMVSVACCGAVTSLNFGRDGNKAFYIGIVNICDTDHT